MAKSRTQIAREHVARLRRKAQAYDALIKELKVFHSFVPAFDPDRIAPLLLETIQEAEKAVAE